MNPDDFRSALLKALGMAPSDPVPPRPQPSPLYNAAMGKALVPQDATAVDNRPHGSPQRTIGPVTPGNVPLPQATYQSQYQPRYDKAMNMLSDMLPVTGAIRAIQGGHQMAQQGHPYAGALSAALGFVPEGGGLASREVAPAVERAAPDAFASWFGNSKVVDEAGKPLVVYHGTNQNFDTFGDHAIGSGIDSGKLGRGFYFSADPNIASSYAMLGRARTRDDAANVMPVHLAMHNPLTIPADKTDLFTKLRTISEQHGVMLNPVENETNRPNPEWSAAFRKALEDAGHDGVILDFGRGRSEYTAFRPEQIKSATGNRGTYDPQDPNIGHE